MIFRAYEIGKLFIGHYCLSVIIFVANIYLLVLKFSNIADLPLNEIPLIKCLFMYF